MLSRVQWVLWSLGLLASIAVLLVIGFSKGGPDWYPPVFVVAAAYCVISAALSAFMRRTARNIPNREGWLQAFSTARVGFLGLIAIAVVTAVVFAVAIANAGRLK